MAFVDIDHKQAAKLFATQRRSISYANVDAVVGAAGPAGATTYRAKAARQPRYMGANIVPLRLAASATAINATVSAASAFSATLAVRSSSGLLLYVDLEKGSGGAAVAAGDEASLVVANTPDALLLFDPFSLSAAANRGLDYRVQLSGATVA